MYWKEIGVLPFYNAIGQRMLLINFDEIFPFVYSFGR